MGFNIFDDWFGIDPGGGGLTGSISDFTDDVLGIDPGKGGLGGSIRHFVNDPLDSLKVLWGQKTPSLPSLDFARNVLITQDGADLPIPVVYGAARLGGGRVFHGVTGAENEYYWRVIELCEGEIEAIDNIYLDDVISTDPKWGSTVQITKYTGTAAQAADGGLITAFPAQWNGSRQLKGVAYLVLRLTFDANIYSSIPAVTADVRGKKLYDTRTATTAYSTNAALAVYDYLTNAIYGRGIPASRIDTAAFNTAANACEAQIEQYSGGPNMDTFACNGVVNTDNDLKSNTERLLSSCRGALNYTAGKYSLVVEQDYSPIYDFNADNIIGAWNIQSASKRSRMNRIKALYINPEKGYQADMVAADSPTYRSADNGLLLETEISLPYETSYYRALHHVEVALKRSRLGIAVSFLASPEAIKIERGEIVTVTHATPGWNGKKFRVDNINLRLDGLVGVVLAEHDAAVYDRSVPISYTPPSGSYLPDRSSVAAPTGLVLASGTNELVLGTDGTIISRIKASWTAAADIYVIGYQVEVKKSSDGAWVPAGATTSRTNVVAYIAPVIDGALYDVRVRAINAAGFYSLWITQSNYTVIGKTEAPGAPQQFLITRDADGTRRFTWLPPSPTPVDLSGYLIRYIVGLGGTWASMAAMHQGVLTSSPWETNQLAKGTYTFGIKAVDTSGNESTAVYIEATLDDPRLASVLEIATPHLDGWPGAKVNAWLDSVTGWLMGVDTKTWADFPGDGVTWANWNTWARAPATLTYTDTVIDIGVSATYTPLLSAEYTGAATLEIRTSDDGIAWSGWAAPAGQVTKRYIQARATIAPSGANCALKTMTFILDAKPVTEDINDLATSSLTGSYRIGVGDIRLPITKTYAVIRAVSIALQNVGAGWTWEVIDKNTSPGPRLKIYNASNALADATIDATVRGV